MISCSPILEWSMSIRRDLDIGLFVENSIWCRDLRYWDMGEHDLESWSWFLERRENDVVSWSWILEDRARHGVVVSDPGNKEYDMVSRFRNMKCGVRHDVVISNPGM